MRRLERLTAHGLALQLQPGRGYKGVVYAGMPLQQLHLEHCDLQDGAEGLAAALLLLPKLQHLCIRQCYDRSEDTFKPWVVMSSDVLYSLQQLTYLELTYCPLQDWHGLRHLTALQDLSLVLSSSNLTGSRQTCIVDGGALSGAQHLTCLQLHSADADVVIHPAVLAGRTALQHLSLYCSMDGGSGGATELLSHLQHLQQLTYLDLNSTLKAIAPAAAYSALTASSNLRGQMSATAQCQQGCGSTSSPQADSCRTWCCCMSERCTPPKAPQQPLKAAALSASVVGCGH